MNLLDARVCFIGGGNMARAMIGGLLAKGALARQYSVVEPVDTSRASLIALGVTALPAWVAPSEPYDVVLLAVKPQMMREALSPIGSEAAASLVISIMAGVPVGAIRRCLNGHSRVVRTMPNTPATIGLGVTALHASTDLSSEDRALADSLMRAVGTTVWVDEETLLNAVTAVSGSGPAYVFYLIEALEAAAIAEGLDAVTARTLAIETFRGAASLAASSQESPASLRQNVTSKGGTTAAALEVFAREDLDRRLQLGVAAANARARALGEEIDRAVGEVSAEFQRAPAPVNGSD